MPKSSAADPFDFSFSERKARKQKRSFNFLKALIAGIGLAFIVVLLITHLMSERTVKQARVETQPAPAGPVAAPEPQVTDPEIVPDEKAAVPDEQPQEEADSAPAEDAAAKDEGEEAAGEGEADAEAEDSGIEADADSGAQTADEGAQPADENLQTVNDDAQPAGDEEKPADIVKLAEDENAGAFKKPFTDAEMDEALKPLLAYSISEQDEKNLREVVALLGKRKFEEAQAATSRIADKSAKALAKWLTMRLADLGMNAAEIEEFSENHPLFPLDSVLAGRMETSLFWNGAPVSRVRAVLANREPETAIGKALRGLVLIEDGESERGKTIIRAVWRNSALTGLEDEYRDRFGSHLTDEDHEARKKAEAFRTAEKRGIAEEPAAKKKPAKRSQKGRSHRKKKGEKTKQKSKPRKKKSELPADVPSRFSRAAAAVAHSLIGQAQAAPKKTDTAADAKTKADAKAKLAEAEPPLPVKRGGSRDLPEQKDAMNAEKKAAAAAFALASEVKAEPIKLYARIKRLRRTNNHRKAWSLLRSLKSAAADAAAPERWWRERRAHVRNALDDGFPKTAYALAKNHGSPEADDLSEAEFMAGWIALRFLKDAGLALPHFEAAARETDSLPRNRARASYWLGRANTELNKPDPARGAFEDAAQHYFTYYGQLASHALYGEASCRFQAPAKPTAQDIKKFVESDAARAVVIAQKLKLDRESRALLVGFAREMTNPAYMTLAFEFMKRAAPPHLMVRYAKIALNRGYATDAYSFPALLPKFDVLSSGIAVERALLHALARQESEFNATAGSPVGASGLMQLMPGTARLVASWNKMKYERGRLTSDPAYNVALGNAYFSRLLSSFDGSYMMAIAGYNAGPGRVSQWVKEFGDPRRSSIDPVDWIERIPFTETREYVQRVMEGLQLYRCRFDQPNASVQLAHDLSRGRKGSVPIIPVLQAGAVN